MIFLNWLRQLGIAAQDENFLLKAIKYQNGFSLFKKWAWLEVNLVLSILLIFILINKSIPTFFLEISFFYWFPQIFHKIHNN